MNHPTKTDTNTLKLRAATDAELKDAYHSSHKARATTRHRMVAAEIARRAIKNPAPDIKRRTKPLI